MAALVFPTAAQAASQTPVNTFSPTSSPLVNTYNSNTYTYDTTSQLWLAAGAIVTPSVPSGSIMPFYQASAPTGWVQNTIASLDDRAIRIVTTAGGGTGGTINFSTLFSPTSTYSGTVTITSGQVGNTTLTTAQLASHSHLLNRTISTLGSQTMNSSYLAAGTNPAGPESVQSAGSSQSHTHSLIGVAAGGNFVSDFGVKYVDMILCIKS